MTGRMGIDLEATLRPPPAGGRERAVRARLTELLGPVEEWSPSLVDALVDSFLSRGADYLSTLAQAITRQDAGAVRADAHSLTGMAGNLGAGALATLGKELESCGRSGQLAGAPKLLARLSAEFDAVRPAMRAVLAMAPPQR